MSDAARKIVEAFATLARAIPGVESIVVSVDRKPVRVSFWMTTDAAAMRLGGLLNVPLQQREWANGLRLSGDSINGDVLVSIYGTQQKAVSQLDEKKVDAALAKVAHALAEVQS